MICIIESVAEVFPGSGVPHQYCQYHFLKNAILSEKHKQLGTLIRDKEVKKEIEKVQREVEIKKKDDNISQIIFLFTSLLLNVTTIHHYRAPFGLYYVELFKTYWHVRRGIRKCIKIGIDSATIDPESLEKLILLDKLLSSVVTDLSCKSIKFLVKKLQYYYYFFNRLCVISKDIPGSKKGKTVENR